MLADWLHLKYHLHAQTAVTMNETSTGDCHEVADLTRQECKDLA
jgi:hypothetical protein